ncbi:Uncharacterized protein OBRU01_22743, partial [Operophtera brumata]
MAINMTEDQLQRILAAMSTTNRKGSFTKCSATYDGKGDSTMAEAFISSITIYKKLEKIDDSDAATWWEGVRTQVITWPDFTDRLRHTFAPKKPAHLLCQEIIGEKQDVGLPTENFVVKKRALIAQLPGPAPTESQQIDMVYGQLCLVIRERVSRNSITTFDELLKATRSAEEVLAESKPHGEKHPQNHGRTQDFSFCAVAIASDARARPTIRFRVVNSEGSGYIDTGAKASVASYELYQILKRHGYVFGSAKGTVTLADGSRKEQNMLTTRVPVIIKKRVIPTTFIIFPEARGNKTLLGVGFLQDAGIVLDIPQYTWHFNDKPSTLYDLQPEEASSQAAKEEPKSILALALSESVLPPLISPLAKTPPATLYEASGNVTPAKRAKSTRRVKIRYLSRPGNESPSLAAHLVATCPVDSHAIYGRRVLTACPFSKNIYYKSSNTEEQVVVKEEITAEEQVVVKEEITAEEQVVVEEETTAEKQVVVKEETTAEEQVVVEEEITAEEQVVVKEEITAEIQIVVKVERISEEQVVVEEEKTAEEQVFVKVERTSEKQAMIENEESAV